MLKNIILKSKNVTFHLKLEMILKSEHPELKYILKTSI